jgi:hypothetical protein
MPTLLFRRAQEGREIFLAQIAPHKVLCGEDPAEENGIHGEVAVRSNVNPGSRKGVPCRKEEEET